RVLSSVQADSDNWRKRSGVLKTGAEPEWPVVYGAGHLDHATDARPSHSVLVLQFLGQAQNQYRVVGFGNRPDILARNPHVNGGTRINHLHVRPSGASQPPFIGLGICDRGIERKRPPTDLVK